MRALNTLFFFILVAFTSQINAQATLSFQGVIKNSDGTAVDNGNYSITFKLYETSSGGTAIWSETQGSVAVNGGIYSVLLGENTPLNAAFDKTYYLSMSVDGGAEIVPRIRLTSSPYALALIGNTNVFASDGNVGIGTATPTKKLEVIGDTKVDGDLEVTGDFNVTGAITGINYTNLTQDVITTGNMSADTITATGNFSGHLSKSGGINYDAIAGDHHFKIDGTDKLVIGSSEINMSAPLIINGSTQNGTNVYKGLYCNNGFCGNNSSFQSVSIKASNYLFCPGVYVTSDQRIKKDFVHTNAKADLFGIQNLRVTDYQYIDTYEQGSKTKKGLIAQEVRKIYPEAVTLSTDFVPSIYDFATQSSLGNGKLSITLAKDHDLVAGDEVKLIMPDGKDQKFTVVSVISEKSFTINWKDAAPERIFVHGKKVDDFHTVDYDYIFTLNVSATQELARRVEQLERENEQLKNQNQGLSSTLNNILGRIHALENQNPTVSGNAESANE